MPTPGPFLIFLAGFIGLGAIHEIRSGRAAATVILLAGIVSGIELLNVLQSFEAQESPLTRVDLEIGSWAAVAGLLGMVLGGLLGLAQGQPTTDADG